MYKEQILKIIRNNKRFNKNSKIIIKDLGMGENNLNYLVIIGKDKYVFRISIKKHLEKNACKEFQFLRFIPESVAPKPVFMDTTKKDIPYYYSVLGYIEGKSIHKWNKRMLKVNIQTMIKLHSKTFHYWKTIGKKRKKFGLYKKMFRDIEGYKKILKRKDLNKLFQNFKNYIKMNDKYFSELKTFHFIHGDLCADNIVFRGKNIHYIDWEWCGIRDNAEDIARTYIIGQAITPWYIGITEKEEEYIIAEYIKNSKNKDKTLRQRVKIWNNYLLFMDMLYFFWKVDNFDKFKSKLPKKKYIEASVKLLRYFKNKSLT